MTAEKSLITKTYYQAFMEGSEHEHPTKVLGELFNHEHQKEVADLAYLRLAQGEVYYHNKDYEAAIFKWGNVNNELMPWALKNIADAHVELDLLQIAEEYYQAVQTDSADLKTEVLLQLFSLYKQRGKLDVAASTIKNAVDLNPDYPDVTDLARVFFEDQHDYSNAVVLAMDEAIRTQSLSWFEVLESYMVQGHTAGMAPASFRNVLMTLYSLNQDRFESMLAVIWRSYKQHDLSLQWLKEINQLLLEINPRPIHVWNELSKLYKETYAELLNGHLLIEDLSAYIPNHVTNWLKISTGSDAFVASSAVLAWNEMAPMLIDAAVVSEAERIVSHSPQGKHGLEDLFQIFDSIRKWAKSNELTLGDREEWVLDELLDSNYFHLMITGSEAVGKSGFVNKLLGRGMSSKSTSATVLFKHADQTEIQAITDEGTMIVDHDEFEQFIDDHHTLISCNMPILALNKNNVTLIDIPVLADWEKSRNALYSYLHVTDGLLYVMNARSIPTYQEIELAIKVKEQVPELPIHFLLSDTESNVNDDVASESLEETKTWIQTYFPNAKVFLFRPLSENDSHIEEVTAFIQSMVQGYNSEEGLERKIFHLSKQLIKRLLEKRVEMESSLLETKRWNEEIALKLDGAIQQLSDLQEEKAEIIKDRYRTIKDKMRQDLLANIPALLVTCADLIKEDSDFDKLHVTLNDEMNKQIHRYIDDVALPNITVAIQGWIGESEVAFKDSKAYVDEMAGSLNQLNGEEKFSLDCDFKVLDDWRRDVDRMTIGSIDLEKNTILKGSVSSQFILKNADKLISAISKNKGTLQNKYKQFVQTKDYSKVAESITNTFMQQFEFFEKSLARDITMFFANPFVVLNKAMEEKQHEIKANEQSLNDMRENPQIFADPLKLFELKIRQYEWMHAEDYEAPSFTNFVE